MSKKKDPLAKRSSFNQISDLLLTLPDFAGQKILHQAADQFRSEREAYVVSQVKMILDRVASIDRITRKHQKQRALCIAQLHAIDAGKFRISEQTLAVIFDEDLLNTSWDDTAQW